MNKGVKHVPGDVETLTASVDFNGPNPHSKEWGAGYSPAPRTYELLLLDQLPQSRALSFVMVQLEFSEQLTT